VLSYDLTDTRVGANTTLELVVRAENSIKEGDFISAYFSESI